MAKNQNEDKSLLSRGITTRNKGSLGVLLTGALLGATALFLSKKENRDKVKKSAQNLANKAEEKAGDVKQTVEKGKKVAQQKIKEVQQKVSEAKDKVTEELNKSE